MKKKTPRNLFELTIFKQIKKLVKKFGWPVGYEEEKLSWIITGHYLPDFVVKHPSGKIYIETKGYFRPEDKRKLAAVKRLHPAADIRIVFYSRRASDIRWCEKLKFPWAVGSVPPEWLNG